MSVFNSAGSKENLDRLLRSEADLALVMRPAFDYLGEEDRRELRVLARLYSDVVPSWFGTLMHWRLLHDLINALVSDEKEHLTRMLLTEIACRGEIPIWTSRADARSGSLW